MSIKGTITTYGATLAECRRQAAEAIVNFLGCADATTEERAEAITTMTGEVLSWTLITEWRSAR